jgi:flagellar biosynthesis protein FlhA
MLSSNQIKTLVLPLVLITSLLVILVPLPTVVMDVLLAVNIATAVLILLTTVFVRTPLEFNIFPTVLLTATLGH